MKEKKNLIIILILLVGVVGITIAYFSNTTSIDNLFSTKKYGSTITEEFISPDSWLPGDETNKSIVATNTGEVDQAVRISYTEKWVSASNSQLNGWIHEDGSKSSHETEEELSNDERVALINFDNNDDWTYNNGYYYYNYRLQPNESTSSLIKSVSFNSKTKLDDTCTTTISEGKKTITCNSSGDNYDGATYTLTFKIETVQYDKYMNAWNTDVAILNEQSLFCDAFEVGEVVEYNNAEYYVLKDSSTSDDYVTLLKKDPLTASEVNQYSDGYVSQDGEYPYYESDTCNELTQTGCSTNYDTSDVKKIVDGWSSSFSDDLVEIDGYKTRLINYNEICNDFNYTCGGYYNPTYGTPEWIYKNINKYWSMHSGFENKVVNIENEMTLGDYVYYKSYIKPVINIKKNKLKDNCIVQEKHFYNCNIGDTATYNNELYYVVKDSDFNKKSVTLLKAEPLTAEEVNQYGTGYVSQNGEYPYYESDTCNENIETGCSTKYDVSDIKKIVDGWSSSFNDDLVSIEGYKTRLINIHDLVDYLGYERYYASPHNGYRANGATKEWAYLDGFKYWSMQTSEDSSIDIYGVSNSLSSEKISNKLYIRPIINVNKSAIESGCHLNNNNNNNYSIGETINYNNSSYCVIKNSDDDEDYITLIRQDPLSYDELVTYNNGYEIERASYNNDIGTMSYYKSDDCYYNSDTDKNTTGCGVNYDSSNIKNVVDNWGNSFNNDLVEVDGYKARLNTYAELIDLGYILRYHGTEIGHFETDSDTKCVGYSYWFNYGAVFGSLTQTKTYEFHPVRPVINLKKCALTNTCE